MAAANPFELKAQAGAGGGLVNRVAPPPAPLQAPATAATSAAPAPAAPVAPTAPLAQPTQRPINSDTDTVQGQLAGLLTKGSPLLVQAQTRADQQANKRGLLNSSLAVSAGEAALYDAALPIAQQDAQTYAQAGEADAGRSQQTTLANSDNQTKLMLQQMDANTRVEMTNIEANYKTLMQASDSASNLYSQTLKNISDITLNKDLNSTAKNAGIARQKELLVNGMNLIAGINALNIDDLLTFDPNSNLVPESGSPGGAPQPGDPGYEDDRGY